VAIEEPGFETRFTDTEAQGPETVAEENYHEIVLQYQNKFDSAEFVDIMLSVSSAGI
jgi:hypothetical protein